MAIDSAAARSRIAWMQVLPTLATFVLLVLAVGCLYWARPVLIPTALAILLTFLLSPLVTWLQRRNLPRVAAVLVVVLAAGLLLGGLGWLVGSQVVQLAADLPTYEENIAKRIEELREKGGDSVVGNVQRFVHGITAALARPSAAADATAADATAEATVPVMVIEPDGGFTWWLQGLGPAAQPVATAGLVILLLIYLLLRREDLRDRMLALVGRGRVTVTTKALDDAGRRISRYLLAQFALNLSFGIVIGVGLFLIGMPHAALWGFMAGVLRYIPYLGPWIAASLPLAMSLLVSPGWLLPLGVVAVFVACELTSNLVVEPSVYGQSIGVSQAALILAIAFWTWLWGPMGLVLAAPLTVCLVVLGKYVPMLKFFDVLLGDEPVLAPDTAFYQRLLARDEDEAAAIVREQAQTLSPVVVCDQVLIPTLVSARHDRQAGQLSDDEYEFVRKAVHQIADEEEIARTSEAITAEAADPKEPMGPPLPILACGAQDGVEITALTIFKQLLDPRQFDFEVLSPDSLVSEIAEFVEERRPAAICIAALPPGGLARTRHLSKRLRQRFPELKILVGRWGSGPELENREDWTNHVDYIAATFEESQQQLAQLSQFLRPPQPANAAEEVPARTTPPKPHVPLTKANLDERQGHASVVGSR